MSETLKQEYAQACQKMQACHNLIEVKRSEFVNLTNLGRTEEARQAVVQAHEALDGYFEHYVTVFRLSQALQKSGHTP